MKPVIKATARGFSEAEKLIKEIFMKEMTSKRLDITYHQLKVLDFMEMGTA